MIVNATTVLEALPAGVIVLNGRGIVSESNPAACELLGFELTGERWTHVIARCFAPQADDGHEVSLRSGRRLNIQTCSLQAGGGQLVMLYDVTETRELQSRVARNERLSYMGRMVASLAHQIRTPLSAAMLYAGHLTRPDMPAAFYQKCATKLQSRLQHLENHIRDLLLFARGDCPVAERIDSLALLGAMKAAAAHLSRLERIHIRWRHEGLPAELVCNRETLVGAVMNLINNAVEASAREGSIEVALRTTAERVIIEVRDQGAGFEPKAGGRLTEAFFTTKNQGTGLGLAVVESIARAHKGQFQITSPGPGQGAVAWIALPILARDTAPATERTTAGAAFLSSRLAEQSSAGIHNQGGYAHA